MALSETTNDAWRRTLCACNKCFSRSDHFDCHAAHRWARCNKVDSYEKMLEERGFARFEPEVEEISAGKAPVSREFKPASREQIAELAAWLSSPEAAAAAERLALEKKAAHERLALEKKAALEAWGGYKFDPCRMEKLLDGMWPEELTEFTNGPMWTAYVHFGKEQKTLQESYDSVKKNIKTDEDYDVAEKAYKALQSHVNTHGQLIREMPSHEHKKPVKTSIAPTHVGRRAARRLQVDTAIAAGSN
jgi:hypothetical protein